jgi:nitrous oxide reductase
MRNDDKPGSTRRREFIKRMGFGGVASAAAATAAVTKGTAEAADPRPPQKGYRETAHVKKFYDLAKF